jgi:hypothetical protein
VLPVIATARSTVVGAGWVCIAARAASVVALMFAAAGAAAGSTVAGGATWVGPVWPGYWPVHPLVYPNFRGACPHYGACVGPWWDERRMRTRSVAPSEPPPAETDIWGSTGSPWGYVRRLPPPTAQSQIQPHFRDASTVRPEFGGPQVEANPTADPTADPHGAGKRGE